MTQDAALRTINRTLVLALVVLVAAPWARAEDDGPAPDLGALLETLVDLPTPGKRSAMAKSLAGREDVSLAGWLAAMRGFGRFDACPSGVQSELASLPIDGAPTELRLTTYVPEGYDPGRAAPLLLAFHGTGGDGQAIWRPWQPVADALGMVVVSPGDPAGREGYTWSPRERAAVWAVLRWARRRFHVDERRIFATGASRGGHLVWDVALRQPDRFAALAPMIGGPRLNPAGGQNNLRYLENLVDVPIRDLQGEHDDRLLVMNLRVAFAKLHDWDAKDAELVEHADRGHDFDFGAVDWVTWLADIARNPLPERVVRCVARDDDRRAAYVEVLAVSNKVKETFVVQVPARRWAAMSEVQKRTYIADETDERTARLEVRMKAPGRFDAEGRHVTRFRMLLTPEMLDEDGRVAVRWRGRSVKKKPTPDAAVLLAEFAERFDRTFLPTAELIVK